MNIEDLKQLIELAKGLETDTPAACEKQLIGEYVIVRCRAAGVHGGFLVDYSGREVVLEQARRLWYWKAAKGHTLNAVAEYGINPTKSKIPVAVKKVVLPEACEIISTSVPAAKSIQEAPQHEIN
jgi:hypothetical protein